MKAEFLWEVFTETGAPEAYLLYKDAGRAASAMSKREVGFANTFGSIHLPSI